MSKELQSGSPTSATVPELPSEDTKPPDMPWFAPNDEEQSVYRFILAAARRARQLQGGARPTISTTSRKPTKIAMEEIRSGAVPVEILVEEGINEAAMLDPASHSQATYDDA